MGNSNKKYKNLDPDKVTLQHFEILRAIGKGAFGKVNAVRRRDTGDLYAMKTMNKADIIHRDHLDFIKNERNIWIQFDHPMIAKCHFLLQDEINLYIIMDIKMGGTLDFHLNKNSFSLERCKFYVAQIACALRYIHSLGYMHRDIKPDNLLLDHEGNISIIDFNLAIAVSDVTGSQSGTRSYMAPEVIEYEIYGIEIDFWSLGITFYEMLFQKPPFEGSWEEMKKKICHKKIRFPEGTSSRVKEAIRGLTMKNPEERWGYEELSQCSLMKDISFEDIDNMSVTPPWKPPDRANVDGIHELNDQLSKKRKKTEIDEQDQLQFEY